MRRDLYEVLEPFVLKTEMLIPVEILEGQLCSDSRPELVPEICLRL